ncbi:MAG: FtsX-like permease family protein, partial [Pseudolysinimonas sp.]
LGAGVAAGILAARNSADEIPAAAWAAAAACALLTVIVMGASAAAASRDLLSVGRARRGVLALAGGARFRSTAAVGVLLLLLLVAIVAVSQFMLYGSPLAPLAGGGVAVDPLAVSAPALAIAAIGLLAVAAFPAVARGLERLARRARDLDSLSFQQLARRPRSGLTPILVVAFGISGLILGACYSGTWFDSTTDTRHVQVGTSVRVTSSPPLSAMITRTVPGQTGSAPVARQDAQLGDGLVDVVGIPSSRLAGAVTAVSAAVDPAALAAMVAAKFDRPLVPKSATGLSVTFTATPGIGLPTGGSVLLVDSVGSETAVNLIPAGDGLAGVLPEGTVPWTVHGINLLLPDLPGGAALAVHLNATGGSSEAIPLDSSWKPSVGTPDGGFSGGGDVGPVAGGRSDGQPGLQISRAGPAGYVLLQSMRSGPARLGVVISRQLAESTGLHVGSTASMVLVTRGGSVPVKVVGVVPVIPGVESGEGILTDLGALQDAASREGLLQVSAGEWWISTKTPGAAAAAERAAQPDADVAVAEPLPSEQVLESARVVVWIAGIATALLALLAVGSGLLAELRTRHDEVQVLRAVGATPKTQVRERVREWSLLLGVGLVVGLVDGVVVCALLVPQLAQVAVPHPVDGLRTYLNLDVQGAGFALAAVVAAIGVLLLVLARTVRRQARLSSRADLPSPTRAGR